MARSDATLAGLVLLAIAAVLAAPVAGRSGLPRLATGLLLLAVGSGVASFGLAALHTWRAARQAPPRCGEGGDAR